MGIICNLAPYHYAYCSKCSNLMASCLNICPSRLIIFATFVRPDSFSLSNRSCLIFNTSSTSATIPPNDSLSLSGIRSIHDLISSPRTLQYNAKSSAPSLRAGGSEVIYTVASFEAKPSASSPQSVFQESEVNNLWSMSSQSTIRKLLEGIF